MDGEGNNTTTTQQGASDPAQNKATGQNDAGTQQQSNQQTAGNQPAVDTEKIKNDAVSEYLKSLGYEDDQLKEIIKKQKEEEEANKTDLQKVQDQLTRTTKKLIEEQKQREAAEAKLSAIKLGARADLVDDLVTIATAKVTKDKDINKVISEIKAGPTGSVYFASETEEEKDKGKNLTGGSAGGAGSTGDKNKGQGKGSNKTSDDDFIERMKQRNATQGKSNFFKN